MGIFLASDYLYKWVRLYFLIFWSFSHWKRKVISSYVKKCGLCVFPFPFRIARYLAILKWTGRQVWQSKTTACSLLLTVAAKLVRKRPSLSSSLQILKVRWPALGIQESSPTKSSQRLLRPIAVAATVVVFVVPSHHPTRIHSSGWKEKKNGGSRLNSPWTSDGCRSLELVDQHFFSFNTTSSC